MYTGSVTDAGPQRGHAVDDGAKGEGGEGVHGKVGGVQREAVGDGAYVGGWEREGQTD